MTKKSNQSQGNFQNLILALPEKKPYNNHGTNV